MGIDKRVQRQFFNRPSRTENFLAWRADEPDGESTYHLELNNLTVHFFAEEWEEFLKLLGMI